MAAACRSHWAFPGCHCGGDRLSSTREIHGPGLTKTRILLGIALISVSYFLLGAAQTLWHFYLVIGLGFGVGMSCMGALAWHRTVIFGLITGVGGRLRLLLWEPP